MITKRSSYYEATVERPDFPALIGTLDTKICIIGGGFAGLATAIGLMERGVTDVVLLEQERIGFGASGRNGGFVFGGFSLDNEELSRQQGAPTARALYDLTLAAVRLIRSRIDRYDIACDPTFAGILLADWFKNPALLPQLQQRMAANFGIDWQFVPGDKLRGLLKTERYSGALWEQDGFHFHPLKYALGLASAARKGGVHLYENSKAFSIDPSGAGFKVTTDQGHVHCQHVVIAGGGYLSGLYPPVERAVLPIATYVVVTEPLGERLSEVMTTAAAIYDTRFAFDYYRPLPDSRILWGGRISIFDRKPHQVEKLLKADIVKVYPQLAGVAIDYSWSGMMSYGRHKMPQIGQPVPGLWHAVGFGGHGVGPTTVAGEILAAAITGEAAIPEALADYGLSPVYRPFGLIAAQASYVWAALRDMIRN